jgi:hypothetical protein
MLTYTRIDLERKFRIHGDWPGRGPAALRSVARFRRGVAIESGLIWVRAHRGHRYYKGSF